MKRWYCESCDLLHPAHALGTRDKCPECGEPVTEAYPRTPTSAFDGQPAFMPSFSTGDGQRFGSFVQREVKPGTDVYVLEAEEIA